MKKQRRKFSKEFRLKVILESLKERSTLKDMATKYELHPNQITNWKQNYLKKSLEILDVKTKKESADQKEKEREKLYSKIGQLQMEVDFLKKKLL